MSNGSARRTQAKTIKTLNRNAVRQDSSEHNMNTDRNKQHLNNFEIQNDMIDTNEQREKQTNFMEAAKATI